MAGERRRRLRLGLRRAGHRFVRRYLFDLLYGSTDRYVMRRRGVRVAFSTADAHSKHWFYPRYARGRVHEPPVTDRLIQSLGEDGVFVDVGAHLGFFACVAGAVAPGGRVYAFEVDANAYGLLETNVRLNGLGNVETFNVGVAEEDGFVSIPRRTSPHPGLSVEPGGGGVSVPCVSLDRFFEGREAKPDMVKIDVEGAELSVLKGMRSLLREPAPALFLELHGSVLHRFGTDAAEVLGFLDGLGYRVFELENHRGAGAPGREEMPRLEPAPLGYDTMCYAVKGR